MMINHYTHDDSRYTYDDARHTYTINNNLSFIGDRKIQYAPKIKTNRNNIYPHKLQHINSIIYT